MKRNKFQKYKIPTDQLIQYLFDCCWIDEIEMEEYLDWVSDEIINDFIDLLEEIEISEVGNKINLDKHPRIEESIREIEYRHWRDYIFPLYIFYDNTCEKSLVRAYQQTCLRTYDIFKSEISLLKHYDLKSSIQITDTYITQNILPIPWCQDGKTYSARLYSNVANFQSKLDFVLREGITKGKGMEWMTQAWQKLTKSTAYNTARLLKTETMAMWSMATKESYLNMGIEMIEIIGDADCGGICNDYVGEVIPLKDAELGDDLPPYHPNCRCEYIAYEEDLGD